MKKPHQSDKQKAEKLRAENRSKSSAADSRRYYFFWSALTIVFLGLIIYSNSYDCSFQLDDKSNITENKSIRNLSDIEGIWDFNNRRFVSYLSFAVNYRLGGYEISGFHLTNVLIHLINSCLVCWMVMLLFASPYLRNHSAAKHKRSIALLAGLLFVSHPLATGSVTYIVQRMASLVALFYFLTVALYMKGRLEESSRKYLYFGGALLSTLIAIHCKENAFTIPFAVLLTEICFFNSRNFTIDWKNHRVLLAVAGIVVFVGFTLSRFSFSILNPIPPSPLNEELITPWNYFLTQMSVITKYIQLLFVPVGQNVDYDFPVSNSFFENGTVFYMGILVALIIVALISFRKNRLLTFGIFWFFITLAIESSFIPITDVIFEHRTYIPSFGFFLLLTSIGYVWLKEKYGYTAMVLFALMVLGNSALAYNRNKVWKTEVSLWTDVISKSPDKARPYMNRGYAYGKNGEWMKAINDFNKVNELKPNYHASSYYNLGMMYMNVGMPEKSFDYYSTAINIDSTYKDAYYGRGFLLHGRKEHEKAIADYSKVIQLDKGYIIAYTARGIDLGALNRWQEAIDDYTAAIRIDSTYKDAFYNRAVAYGTLGDWKKSIADLDKVLELDPNNRTAYSNREYARRESSKQQQ